MKGDLKKKRKSLNMSQIDLAAKIGVTVLTVQLWERGVGSPNPENRKKLERALTELEANKKKKSL